MEETIECQCQSIVSTNIILKEITTPTTANER